MSHAMAKLKRYLRRRRVEWKPTPEWSLVFRGNYPEGIYIKAAEAPLPYIGKQKGLAWKYRGNGESVYVFPRQ